MQRYAVTDSHFFFDDRRVRSVANVYDGVVLDVRAIADANVMNVAADRAVAPDRSLFAEVHVAYNLSARIHVGCWVNLWMNPTKRSNHDLADSNIGIDPCYIAVEMDRRFTCLFLVVIGLVIGATACSSSLFKVKPVTELPPLPAASRSADAGGVTVRAAPLLTDEESQELFEANLPLSGVLPLRVELTFQSGVPVETRRARFRLRDNQNQEWKLLSPKSAISRILKANGVFAYNPNSRKQFENEFSAYAIDLKQPLSTGDPRRQGFLFFQTPDKQPVKSDLRLTLTVERLPQVATIQVN